MNLFQLLMKGGVEIAKLEAILRQVAEGTTDLAPAAAAILDKLDGKVTPESVLALAKDIVPELVNIAQGKIDSRFHPGDAA